MSANGRRDLIRRLKVKAKRRKKILKQRLGILRILQVPF